MNKFKKISFLFLILILGFLLPATTSQAKVEQTTEITLIDMGHGIFVPSCFDVIYADGSFATISEIDPSPWQEQVIDEESYSITLENGYRAEKTWTPIEGGNTGYPCISIYNENGERVFFLGRDLTTITFAMVDGAGNNVKNTYSRWALGNDYETTKSNSGGETIVPLTRTTYSAEEDVRKNYTTWGDIMKLSEKYEYGAEGGGVCHLYNLMSDAYDLDDEYYEACSYKKEDIKTYWLRGPVYDPMTGKAVYMEYPSQQYSVKTINGQEFYLYQLEQWDFGEWSLEEEREVMDGKPMDIVHYFTKEEIEILKAENITTYEELMERHPDFWDSSFYIPPGVERTVVSNEPSPAEEAAQRAKDAVISSNTDENAGESEENLWTGWIETQSGRALWQPLTGDVLPINGSTPVWLFTNALNTPEGIRYTVALMDADRNDLVGNGIDNIDHTNYKYAYLTYISFAGYDTAGYIFFQVAGTDTPISGNLQYMGESTVDTDKGPSRGSVYIDPNYMW